MLSDSAATVNLGVDAEQQMEASNLDCNVDSTSCLHHLEHCPKTSETASLQEESDLSNQRRSTEVLSLIHLSGFLSKMESKCTILSTQLLQDVVTLISNRPGIVDINSSMYKCNRYSSKQEFCLPMSCKDGTNKRNVEQKARRLKESSTAVTPSRSPKRKKPSPNYFIAIPIMSEQIREKIGDIQQHILRQNDQLEPLLVPLATLHLTIMVMNLADSSDVEQAKAILDQCRTLLAQQSTDPVAYSLSGLGHFNHSVLFARICNDVNLKRLKDVAETVSHTFSSSGIPSTDSRGFQPHVTVMKMSRAPKLYKQGIRKIDPCVYADFADVFLGLESASRLQLCAMDLPKDEQTGYYHIAHEVQLF